MATLATVPFVAAVNARTGPRTVSELAATARTRRMTFGSAGNGSVNHLLGEMFNTASGAKMQHVPYKGASQSTLDLISGRIDAQIDGISTAVALHNAGKTRIMASMGAERSIIPDGVQTFVEAGYPQLVAYANFSVMAPAGTPEPVIRKLHTAIVAALAVPRSAAPKAIRHTPGTSANRPASQLSKASK